MKLRYALGDSPESPVFIETVPRRGYRFIAPVQILPVETDPTQILQASPTSAQPNPESLVLPPSDSMPKWTAARLIAFGLVVVGAGWFGYLHLLPSTSRHPDHSFDELRSR